MSEDILAPALPESFEHDKRMFFATLAYRNNDLMNLHRDSGQIEISAEKYGVNPETGRAKRWGDPTQHCLVEAAAVDVLADLLINAGAELTPEDKEDLVKAALIHDWRKKGEIEELNAAKQGVPAEDIPTVTSRATEVSYRKSKDDLAAYGIPEKIVGLTEAVAHTSLPDFADVAEDGTIGLKPDIPVANLAMHYVDDITRGTSLVDLDVRMDDLDKKTDVYSYNAEAVASRLWGGLTYFQAQRAVGHLVENRLAELTGVADPSTLPGVLEQGIIDNIITFGQREAA